MILAIVKLLSYVVAAVAFWGAIALLLLPVQW